MYRDVKLTLVHKDLVDRGLARSEEDDIEDSELSYDQISPLDKVRVKVLNGEQFDPLCASLWSLFLRAIIAMFLRLNVERKGGLKL